MLNIGDDSKNIDIIWNFKWKECQLILNEDCKPYNKYTISCNLINPCNDIYQM
jgi:hypothetical protein